MLPSVFSVAAIVWLMLVSRTIASCVPVNPHIGTHCSGPLKGTMLSFWGVKNSGDIASPYGLCFHQIDQAEIAFEKGVCVMCVCLCVPMRRKRGDTQMILFCSENKKPHSIFHITHIAPWNLKSYSECTIHTQVIKWTASSTHIRRDPDSPPSHHYYQPTWHPSSFWNAASFDRLGCEGVER